MRVLEQLAADPEAFDAKKRWSVLDARRVLAADCGVELSIQRVHALLVKLGYRFLAGLGWRKEVHEKLPPVAPWGFKRDRSGRLVPNEEERSITAIVRHAYLQGFTLPEIVAMLKKRRKKGRTGRPIGTTRVFEMIRGRPARRKPTGSEEPVVKRSSTRIRARGLPAVISRHIQSARERATFVQLEDGSYGARVPGLRGFVAVGDTLDACRAHLAQVVSGWRKLVEGLQRRYGSAAHGS